MRRFLIPVSFLVLGVIAACGQHGPAPLAPVTLLPVPTLPSWISSISPTKQAQTLAQIRVIFSQPVTTVGALEGNGPTQVLSHFRIDPALQGAFVVLTPKMVGFVPEQALPVGTRVRITLKAGLHDLSGDSLSSDLAWTFQTAPLSFNALPTLGPDEYGDTPAPAGLNPTLTVTANAQVDPASLAANTTLLGGGENIPVDATLEQQPTPMPGSSATEAFDPSLNTWIYDLRPRRALQKATTYQLTIAPGVAPAYGNVSTQTSYSGAIRTYSALAIVPTPIPSSGTYGGRFARGDPVISFNNPLDPKSLAANVAISPSPQSSTSPFSINVDDAPSVISINPYFLAPRTTYTITLGRGLADTFGQQLGSSQTIIVQTGDFSPGIWAPSGTNVFPSVENIALNIFATNLPGNSYSNAFQRIAPAMLVNGDDANSLLPSIDGWTSHTVAGAKPNVQSVVRVPLRTLLGGSTGVLAYGVSTTFGPDNVSTSEGLVVLTDLGIFAQTFPSRAIVRVQHLSDGSPVAGASVTLYRTSSHPSNTPCARATTDSGGTAQITGDVLQACYAGNTTYAGEAPSVLAVASSGRDWSYALVNSWSGAYNIQGDTSWSSGAPLSRGTIFTDRQMYQPGETARITGVAYAVRNGVLAADRNAPYAITLTDPSGRRRSLGSVQTDAFGVFSLPLTFGANQALGYYSLAGKSRDGNEIDGGLRVAIFKPPNFKLDVSFDHTTALAGSNVTASAQASYLFGGPLAGAAANVNVTRNIATLAPPGWDNFSFGRQWFWPDQQPSFDTDVLETGGTFSNTGSLTQTIPVAADLPFPMTYSVDIQATDVSNLSVDTTQTFTALASDGIIGLNTDFLGRAGQPFSVQAIVTGLDGKSVAGRAIHIELQSMKYTAATQLIAGGQTAQNGVQYTTVGSADVTPGNTPATVQLHPTAPGPYRVRANFGGASSDASETDVQIFVVGAGEVNWGSQDNTVVNVKLDKKSYKIGQTATALIASPFAQSDIYFAVVRQDVLVSRLIHATGDGPTVSFPVTAAMLPNAAVEVLVVRRGPSIRTLQPGTLDSLSRIGFVPLHVDLADRYLKVAIAPQHASLEPGSKQNVALRVKDSSGRPASGEAVVMVVNDAILQLTGYRPPDLVQTVFADQPISTRYADNRAMVALAPIPVPVPVEKGWGYGGGFLAGAGSTRVRTNFQPLAYYALVHLDARGTANVAFTLPDDLTTWRAMAVAIGNDDMHFGGADTTFIATKRLLTNPLLPQFARPGDTIEAGLSVLDTSGGGTLHFHGEATGALTFASGKRTIEQTSTIGNTTQGLRFPITVGTPAPTTLFFSSAVGTATDAFRVPFSVTDQSTTESVIEVGATSTNASVPINFSTGGSVRITIANSVVQQFALPAASAMAADPQPFLDDAASRLIIASAMSQLAPRYHLTPGFDVAATQRSALAAIFALQQSDGGFALFHGIGVSDPFESAYAVEALGFARDRGMTVDPHALQNAKAYLAMILTNPGRYAWCDDAACIARLRLETLIALAALGDRRNDFLSSIIAQQAAFDTATQVRLARYLLSVPGYHAQGLALATQLEQLNYRTGRYTNVSVSDRWGWLGSVVEAQSQMLQLLLERGSSTDETDGAVQALVAQQCGCGWGTLLGTAQAIQALSEYATHERLVPFTASVLAGGKILASASFGTTASSQTATLPASSIHSGTLVFRSSGGALHYALLYTYPVADNAPGQLAGLRVIRDVRLVNASALSASMDLGAIATPLAFGAGNVYDVGVRVIVDHPIDRLIIEDPLPAGLEAVDTTLRTSSTAVLAAPDSWQIENQQIYADRVTAYADHLEPGVYEMHYLARAVTPGSYRWPGARAFLRDAPEVFGRTAFTVLRIL